MIVEISDRLTLIGTSHIARQSHKEIKDAFEKYAPDVIAIELDQGRLHSLLHPVKNQKYPLSLMRQVGVVGYVFVLLGSFAQKKMGNIVGMQPGAEMKLGYTLAKEHQKRLVTIDRPMQQTLRMLKGWKKREIFRMLWDLMKSPFVKDQSISMDLSKVPSEKMLAIILEKFKESYPSLYTVLVSSRNTYMTTNLKNYHKKFPDDKVLAIVGAGHIEGMVTLLAKK